MTEVTLKISGIDCAACLPRLERALSALDGVESAAANYASGKAGIVYDESVTNLEEIARRVKRAGFSLPVDRVTLKCAVPDEAARSRVLAALSEVHGVMNAEAVEGGFSVSLYPIGIDSRLLLKAAKSAGVCAELGETENGEENDELEQRFYLLRLLIISAVLTMPLLIGLATGLMPCGALYAVWAQAAAAGSALNGGLIMLCFALGTVPLLLVFGAWGALFPKSLNRYMTKLGAVLVLSMGLKMLINGLRLI